MFKQRENAFNERIIIDLDSWKHAIRPALYRSYVQ